MRAWKESYSVADFLISQVALIESTVRVKQLMLQLPIISALYLLLLDLRSSSLVGRCQQEEGGLYGIQWFSRVFTNEP